MDRQRFFDAVRARPFGGRLTGDQVKGMEALLDYAPADMLEAELAYCLATTYHETGHTMQPNVENLNYTTAARIRNVWPTRFHSVAAAQPFVRNPRGLANEVYNGRMGNRTGSDDGWSFRGRGLPHLTGRFNYQKASDKLGVDLVSNPDLAVEMRYAAPILYAGMSEGWFTGRKLADYFRSGKNDPVNARRIVNGLDRARDIAGYHENFLAALRAGGYVPGNATIPPPPDVEPVEDDKRQESASERFWRELFEWLRAWFGSKP